MYHGNKQTEKENEMNGNMSNTITIEGTEYDLRDLPDDLTVDGDLRLRNLGLEKLPENLTVTGSLDVSYNYLASLPDSLSVGRRTLA